jgi:hypothetical protein
MFQYFPDEDVAVASVEGQVFLLSRAAKSGSFRAVGVSGMDLTQPAVEAGFMETFLAAADSALTVSMSVSVLRTMDEDELFEEKDRLDSAGLLGSVETLAADLCREESLLSAVGPTESKYQGLVVWIAPRIPEAEKLAFVRDIVSVRHRLMEKPWVEEPTYDALFSRVDLAAWWRVLRLLDLYPCDKKGQWERLPFHAWPVRQLQVHATPALAEDVCVLALGVLLMSWETLKAAAARSLGPEEFASGQAYARARRAAADLTGRAVETTSDLLGKLRSK